MSMPCQNKLTIEPFEAGSFRLFGKVMTPNNAGVWINTKIRKRSKDLSELMTMKEDLERAALAYVQGLKNRTERHETFLSHSQLRDAESAYRILPPTRTLKECVEAGLMMLGDGAPVAIELAVTEYEVFMKRRKLEASSMTANMNRLARFTTWAKKKMLPELTSDLIENYVRRDGVAPLTAVGDAAVLHTFFKFCVKPGKFIKINPVQLDMKELRKRAKPTTEPEIFSPEEAQALLDSCVSFRNHEGQLVPGAVLFVIASTWCFMRKSEVLRLKPEQVITTSGAVKIHLRGKKIGSKFRYVTVPSNVAPLLLDAIKRGAFIDKLCDKSQPGYSPNSESVKFSVWDWRMIRARAGLLKLKHNPKRPSRPITESSDWAPSILRHTGMSYLYQETGDAEEVTKRAGNSEDVAFVHYLRHAEPDAFKKFNAVTATFPVTEQTQAVA